MTLYLMLILDDYVSGQIPQWAESHACPIHFKATDLDLQEYPNLS
jgi:hypothetical protein